MAESTPETVPFSSHLDELRRRLIWVLLGLFLAFTLVFSLWADDIVRYIIEIAVVTKEVDGKETVVPIPLTVISPLETFSTTMRVSLYAALVFGYPWVMLQAYLFVAPGLYRHERRFFQLAIPSIFLLFAAGAAFGRYILLPISIPFLLDFNVDNFGVHQSYALSQFLGLVFTLTFGLGFVFQIPLIVAPLIRFGLLSPQFFKSKRRYTLLVSIVLGAIISPTGSPVDMLITAAPIFLLVEGGVWIGAIWKRAVLRDAEKRAKEAAERGEVVDPEALAGGLAIDLEKKLKDFSAGGARKLARELVSGFKEGATAAKSVFDDNYADGEKPPQEVKLKKRTEPPAATPPTEPKPDQAATAATPVTAEATAEPKAATPAAAAPDSESETVPRSVPAYTLDSQTSGNGNGEHKPAAATDDEYPDRPWDENVSDGLARYIEDRISQRLEQFFDREFRPWMARIEHELRDRNGDQK